MTASRNAAACVSVRFVNVFSIAQQTVVGLI